MSLCQSLICKASWNAGADSMAVGSNCASLGLIRNIRLHLTAQQFISEDHTDIPFLPLNLYSHRTESIHT